MTDGKILSGGLAKELEWITWHPIDGVLKDGIDIKDGRDIIVGYYMASVWIVRSAWWRDGEDWEEMKFDNQEEVRGWWSYDNSVGQSKLEDMDTPTHWMPLPKPPEEEMNDD